MTSFLQAKGAPGMVERTLVRPPASQLGPVTPEERRAVIEGSDLDAKYRQSIDRTSAFERLAARATAAADEAAQAADRAARDKAEAREYTSGRRYDGGAAAHRDAPRSRASRSDSLAEAFGKSVVRQIGSSTGRAIVRGILGSLFKSR